MPQFIIQAKDYTDEESLKRRLAARSAHLERMKEERNKGVFVLGGALLDNNDRMIGSVIILSLPNEESVWQWIRQDVYVTGTVWNEITVNPFRVADV